MYNLNFYSLMYGKTNEIYAPKKLSVQNGDRVQYSFYSQ